MSLSLTVDIFFTFICFFYYLLWTHFLGRDYRATYYSYSVPTLREKCPKYIVLSGPYFSAFRLNMDIYSVNHSVMTTMFKLPARVRNTIYITELTYWTTLKFYGGCQASEMKSWVKSKEDIIPNILTFHSPLSNLWETSMLRKKHPNESTCIVVWTTIWFPIYYLIYFRICSLFVKL